MDELSFRRRIYADPNDNQQDIIDACNQDPKKAQFKADLQSFDDKLNDALNIDTPDNLADRILLSQTIDFQQHQKKKSRVHLALAASVAFAVGLSFQVFNSGGKYTTLSEHALAHVYDEEHHLHDDYSYSSEDLNVKLASFGASITNSIAPITFASYCRFDGVKSLHLVFQGENAPVTVFLVPNSANLTGNSEFSDDRMNGNIVSFENADMVIVADEGENSAKWQQKLTSSIQWQKA